MRSEAFQAAVIPDRAGREGMSAHRPVTSRISLGEKKDTRLLRSEWVLKGPEGYRTFQSLRHTANFQVVIIVADVSILCGVSLTGSLFHDVKIKPTFGDEFSKGWHGFFRVLNILHAVLDFSTI